MPIGLARMKWDVMTSCHHSGQSFPWFDHGAAPPLVASGFRPGGGFGGFTGSGHRKNCGGGRNLDPWV